LRGSENNDAFNVEGGKVTTATNRHGGILGGRTSGMPIVFRVAMKPTPTVFKELESVDLATMTSSKYCAKGRHDPCIARRAMPVVEAVAAIALVDMLEAHKRETSSICLVLACGTLEENVNLFNANRYFADFAELRVDKLNENERDNVAEILKKIDVPVVLTFRRKCDGGDFVGDEETRRDFFAKVFSAGAKFAYVDFEDDFRDADLTKSAIAAGTKIIRSMHDFGGKNWNLQSVVERLSEGGAIPKVAFAPRSLSEVAQFFKEAALLPSESPRILCAMGNAGLSTRILASKLGSLWTYASQGGIEANIGHVSTISLVRDFRLRAFTPRAEIKFVAGESAFEKAEEMNAFFTVEEEDAVAIPFEGFSKEDVAVFSQEVGFGELV
jgi:3-dehydroquinate dehydratase type I